MRCDVRRGENNRQLNVRGERTRTSKNTLQKNKKSIDNEEEKFGQRTKERIMKMSCVWERRRKNISEGLEWKREMRGQLLDKRERGRESHSLWVLSSSCCCPGLHLLNVLFNVKSKLMEGEPRESPSLPIFSCFALSLESLSLSWWWWSFHTFLLCFPPLFPCMT